MKNFHLFLLISATLQLVAHGAPITNGGVCHSTVEVCDNPACTKEAENINNDMKRHLNPCDDFEQFACGVFLDNAKAGQSTMNDILQAKADEIVKGLANPEDPNTPKPDSKDQASVRNVQRMHINFAACMNEAQHIKAGRDPLKRRLEEMVKTYSVPGSLIEPRKVPGVTIKKNGITGQFLHNGWTTSINLSIGYSKATGGNTKNDLSAITGQFLGNGLTTLVKFGVFGDERNPNLNLVYVNPTSLGLPAPSYQNPSRTQEYEQLIGEMFYILYEPNDPLIGKTGTPPLDVPSRWKEVAKKVVAFETEFAAFIPSEYDNDTDDDNLHLQMKARWLTISQMNDLTPSLDWNVIFKSALPIDVGIPKDVAAMDLDYLKKLNQLLTKTDPKTIQLFFAWSMIRQYSRFLDVTHRRTVGRFRQKSNDSQNGRTCAMNTMNVLPDVVSHYFVQYVLPEPVRAKVQEIINTILSTYSKSFQTKQPYDWLTDDTRKRALLKLTKLGQIVGYSYSGPDNRNPSLIDEFYSGFKLDGQDYFGNQVRAKTFWAQVKFRKLNRKPDPLHMRLGAPTNNAYNSQGTNTIGLPAGRMQSPMFNVDFPEYLNYAGYGMTVAHEITHSFDNTGIYYDESGHKSDWFKPSLEAFNDRARCLVKQFSNFTIKGPDGKDYPLKGDVKLRENIADNGGIDKAYDAWFERYRSDPKGTTYNNKRLPSLEEYSPEQMFFIQYARSMCTKPNPNNLWGDLNEGHSPARWRIIGGLQNSQNFARAFSCKPGSPMNPVKTKDNNTKCDVWSKSA
ncbi:hypothetical protein BGX34_008755 [Mortierella sp. NVP85]|nr:hypothetical protein BGX34_008755 [Mortierella sp. NVP85]